MKTEEELLKILETIRQTAYDLHVYLGNGYLEKVYENALRNRLAKKGMNVKTQAPLKVYDEDGSIIGDYQADMLVEDNVIVELKATKALAPEHYAQTMNYLKTTGLKFALLINFGSYRFEVRRIISTFGHKKPCRNVENVEYGISEVGVLGQRPSLDSSTFSPSPHGLKSCAAGPQNSTFLHGTQPSTPASSTFSPSLHGLKSCAAGHPAPSTFSTSLHG